MARKMRTALYELQNGDPSLMLEGVRRCLEASGKSILFRIFSGRKKEDDVMSAIELAELVALAWSKGIVTLRGPEMYTVLRAYLKGISCMQKYPEYALDMRARAKMTGRLLMAFIPYAMAGKKPEAEHILLSMKGRVVALDNKGVRCVDEATVFQFAEEIYRFWDAHRGHSDGKLALLAEEMDHYLDGDSRAIQRAKRRLANKP